MGEHPICVAHLDNVIDFNAAEMMRAMENSVLLEHEDRSSYQARWQQLKSENAPIRVVDGKDLVSAPIDHFDDALIQHATPEWQKMAKVLAGTLGEFHCTGIYQAGDLILQARLADLAEERRLDWRGNLNHMRDCELRLPPRP